MEFDLAEQSTPELTTPATFLSFDQTQFAGLSDPSLEESLRYYFRVLLGSEQHP
ncbi:MAG: hypothetical protein GY788_06340, partial [bacterium]|nr:hypothetical protein [bacterium]